MQFWALPYKRGMGMLVSVQQRAMQMMKGLHTCKKGLKELLLEKVQLGPY